jgi:hypothetical protein
MRITINLDFQENQISQISYLALNYGKIMGF